jgi:uncharacterized protein (TIGR02284 family)
MAAEDRDLNRDPITDEPGAHPVGTGLGATGGAVAGAAVGAIGGPVGAAVGGVVGAVVGGLAGKAAGEAVNPTAEEAFWRENYTREPYYEQGRSFDDYGPAYRLGLTGRTRYEDDWTTVEPRLATEWNSTRGSSSLEWQQARPASRAAWDRVNTTYGSGTGTGVAGAVGGVQTMGDNSGDNADVIDVLNDLKSLFLQRADDCRAGAQELQAQIRSLGGRAEDSGSTAGALHRGWVSVKATLSSYDDKAVLEEAERGEDNALARYRKALGKRLPAGVKLIVERQLQGVQRNHDQIKMLRDQLRAAS